MYQSFYRPLLFKLDPETAHHLTTASARAFCSLPLVERLMGQRYNGDRPELEQTLGGLCFPNPVGMAAGFDKNAAYLPLLRFLGTGYAEIGSITARPSAGNPKPRLFRLPEDRALINRMGLNNDGAETICRRIREMKQNRPDLFHRFPCGVNIAKTHDPAITGDHAIRDYLISYQSAGNIADYITLNISCPNTAEGKTFEDPAVLSELLDAVMQERGADDPPILVKWSPDLDQKESEQLISVCENRDIQGYVIGNTSSRRTGLHTTAERLEEIGSGGLSGAPLFPGALKHVGFFRDILPSHKIIIACGGIDSADKAVRLLNAGADLLQIYTGLIYEGPSLISRINTTIAEEMNKENSGALEKWSLRKSQT